MGKAFEWIFFFCSYMPIWNDENQYLLKTFVSASSTLTLYSDLQNILPPLPYIYGRALILFTGNVPQWPYILACPFICHL